MKLLFFIQNMGQGGAQRSLLTLLPEMKELLHHEVYLAFWEEEPIAYGIPNSINAINLGKYRISQSKTSNYIHSIKIVIKTIKNINPDYVIATMCDMYMKVFLGNLFTRKKLIVWEHTSLGRQMQKESEIARKYFYRFADKVVVLTAKDKKLVGNKYKETIVIPNAVPFKSSSTNELDVRENAVIAIGRINVWHVKGFDLLMKIWSNVCKAHPNWKLKIAGDGTPNNIDEVKSFIKENNVENSVELLGYRNDMDSLLKHSKIFALSSRVEGFPMSVIEAMSQGCGCVCFSVCGAIQDIITNTEDGFIIEDGDIAGFSEKLSLLMDNPEELCKMSLKASESVMRFTPSNVALMWDRMLKGIQI